VLWAHASNNARLEQSYQEIAELVKVRGRKDPQADVFKLVHDWLRNEKNAPWLLVFDNADNPDNPDDAALCSSSLGDSQKLQTHDGTGVALRQHLSRYPLPSRHGSVLLTSRTKRAAMQIVEESDIVTVEPMDGAAAHALLYQKLGDAVDRSDGIAQLAVALDHMPLALVQAAAYIRQRAPRCSVQQYLNEYRQSDSRKTSLLNQEAGHLRRDEAASNAILLTWQISFDHIRRSRQSAADLLSLMSFFDRQGIQDALLRNTSSTANPLVSDVEANDRFEDDVTTLRDYSFIKVTKDANTFEMHSLVQLATREWLKSQGQVNRWREQFISNLCAELPIGEHKDWETCEALFPHAKAALAQQPQDKESLKKWARLLFKAACYAWQRGRLDESERMSVVSMEIRREVLGEESEETLDSMKMVGLAKELGGKQEETEVMIRQILAWKEKVLGREHPETLLNMAHLASVLNRQGKYKEAEVMNQQTLVQAEKVLGPEHSHTLTSMNNLVLVLISNKKYKEAEVIIQQMLEQQEKVLGPEHPDTLASMYNLASVLNRQGKNKEAEAMNQQTLAQQEKVLGRKHPNTLMSVYRLATLLACQRRFDESLALYQRACAGYSVVLGEDHPTTRMCRQHLSKVLALQEQTQISLSLATPDDSASTHTGKLPKLSRRLADPGISDSKRVKR
jgi:tetratricopeptide (TPR) repeat protein